MAASHMTCLILDGYRQVQPGLPHFLLSLEDKHWMGPVGLSWACGNAYRRKNSSEDFFFCRAVGARDNRLLSYTLKSYRSYRITNGGGDLKSPSSLNHNTDGGWREDVFTLTDSTPVCQDIRGESD